MIQINIIHSLFNPWSLIMVQIHWQRNWSESRFQSKDPSHKFPGHSLQFSSVAQSCMTPCDPMDCMQHTRLPCPSPTPRAYSNSYPSSWWCHPTISFSAAPFSSCLQSFPVSGSFLVSQFFASGGQSIGASASTSVLPMNIRTNLL